MAKKDYAAAIDLYSKALAIVPKGNPIFLSNRAAAYSASRDHESARADAEVPWPPTPNTRRRGRGSGSRALRWGMRRAVWKLMPKGIEYEGTAGVTL